MNLSDILKEENPTVRHVLLGNWKQDQDWKDKMEQRVRDLEKEKQHQKGSDMLKRLEYKSNLKKIGYQSDNSA